MGSDFDKLPSTIVYERTYYSIHLCLALYSPLIAEYQDSIDRLAIGDGALAPAIRLDQKPVHILD